MLARYLVDNQGNASAQRTWIEIRASGAFRADVTLEGPLAPPARGSLRRLGGRPLSDSLHLRRRRSRGLRIPSKTTPRKTSTYVVAGGSLVASPNAELLNCHNWRATRFRDGRGERASTRLSTWWIPPMIIAPAISASTSGDIAPRR